MSYNEKQGKRKMYTVEHRIWMSCTEKHRKWETHSVEHVYKWVTMKNMQYEKCTL
jgi:hypothetical protein